MTRGRAVLGAVHAVRRRPHAAISLGGMAAGTTWSPFHFHRVFTEAVGETPKQYITDPADHPDPAAWRTEVYWPLEK